MPAEAPRSERVGACPLCGASGAHDLFAGGDRLHGTRGTFIYRRCAGCGSAFQDPRVVAADLHLCYPSDYYTHDQNAISAGANASAANARPSATLRDRVRDAISAAVQGRAAPGAWGAIGRALALSRSLRERAFFGAFDDLIPRAGEGGHALEVGCGNGEMLRALAALGWDIEGLEWDERAAAIARANSGRPVAVGDFTSLPLPARHYRLIVMHHVFEHFHDPRRVLARIAELLTADGRCVLVFPNPGAMGARLFGADWFPWEAPRHLVLPSPAGLRQAARAAGLAATVRTVARTSARGLIALSRAYRRGEPGAPPPSPDTIDLALILVEKLLTRVGLDVGEEMVVTLRPASVGRA